MFYLKEFYQLFRANRLLSIIFLFSIMGIVISVTQKEEINYQLTKAQSIKLLPYFNALIQNGTNIEKIQRKMSDLPGVSTVKLLDHSAVSKEVKKLQQRFDKDLLNELSSLKLQRIKVELESGLLEKNQNLIKEYLARLVGKESITIGAVKRPSQFLKRKETFQQKIMKWGDIYIISFFSALFLMSIFLIQGRLNKQSYIIEKFQRKKYVKTKIMFAGASFAMGTALILNISLFKSITVMAIFPILIVTFTILALGTGLKLKFSH